MKILYIHERNIPSGYSRKKEILRYSTFSLLPFLICRIDKVSVAIHALISSTIFLANLVFTEIAANRGDNDTVFFTETSPSPFGSKNISNGRPTVRLIIFGSLYVAYLALKAYQLMIDNTWYKYKKRVDEICVMIGGVLLCLLISTTTLVFAKYVVAPVFVALILARYMILGTSFHSCLLQFFHIKGLEFRKGLSYSYYSIKVFVCRIRLQNPAVQAAHQQALDAAVEVRTQKINRWNEVIQTAKNTAAGGDDGNGGRGGQV